MVEHRITVPRCTATLYRRRDGGEDLATKLQVFPATQLLEDGNAANLEPPGNLYVIPVLMLLAGAAMVGRGMIRRQAATTATAETNG